MDIADILIAERVACDVEVSSKKKALEQLGQLLAKASPEWVSTDIFDTLYKREALSSTGLGHGVALPHGRLAQAERAAGAFLRLATPLDFAAPDGEPVDLLFGLIVPEEATAEHLEILSRLAERFRDARLREQVRGADHAHAVFALLTAPVAP